MSLAKTKHQIENIRALAKNAQDLIESGGRDDHMIRVLRRALQLFKENRLAATIPFGIHAGIGAPSNALELYSIDIADSDLDQHARKYLQKWGVRYVGEIARLNLGANQKRNSAQFKAYPEIVSYMARIGLPLGDNPLDREWTPPYWRDPAIRTLMDMPMIEVLGLAGRSPEDIRGAERWNVRHWGAHYVGEFLQTMEFTPYAYRVNRLPWEALKSRGVHGNAYLPHIGWQVPRKLPEEWLRIKDRFSTL
jgi:hypothetical protein